MHTNRISPARKILAWLAALAVFALLSGCDTVTLTNLTPGSMPENPSQIYTFTLRVTPRTNTVPLTSIAPHVIVDGKSFDMKRSPIGEGIFEFEYQVPSGRDALAYYFLVNYLVEGNNLQTRLRSTPTSRACRSFVATSSRWKLTVVLSVHASVCWVGASPPKIRSTSMARRPAQCANPRTPLAFSCRRWKADVIIKSHSIVPPAIRRSVPSASMRAVFRLRRLRSRCGRGPSKP